MNIIQALMNPKKYVLEVVKKQNNPFLNNIVNLAEQGKTQEVENIVRNLYKEKGQDYDKTYNQLMNMINRGK